MKKKRKRNEETLKRLEDIARVFSEVPFLNSAKYGILYGIGIISRNSVKFFTVQFRVGSCIRNSIYLQMKIQLLNQ
jgi:hypothetical protein